MENYFKYKFYTVGQIEKDLFITGTRLGQINAKVPVKDIQTNLFDLIVNKYSNDLSAGKEETVTSIYALSIIFNDEPLLVYNNAGMLVYGFNIELNGKKITINSAYTNIYQFDNEVIFTPEDSLIFFGSDDEKNLVDTIDITANFLYDVTIRPIKERQILYKKTVKNIGQIYKSFNANDSIYREIYYRHKYDWDEYFRVLSQMDCVNIEANPGTTIQLKDVEDHDIGDKHIINETGVLDLTGIGAVRDLIYLGITDLATGELIDTEPSDILVDYMYYLTEGKYATKEE
jgi:hypothetical protein